MSDGSILDRLFPPAPPHTKTDRVKYVEGNPANLTQHTGKSLREGISTRWTSVYTLELRGLTQKQIAEALGMSVGGVGKIVTDPRYIEYRERHLSALDQEFVAMKPLAFAALKSGLNSQDENTALRASEQWFKGANYGGFSKHERPATTATAEDIARQLLTGIQVNVQVNTGNANDTHTVESESHGGDA